MTSNTFTEIISFTRQDNPLDVIRLTASRAGPGAGADRPHVSFIVREWQMSQHEAYTREAVVAALREKYGAGSETDISFRRRAMTRTEQDGSGLFSHCNTGAVHALRVKEEHIHLPPQRAVRDGKEVTGTSIRASPTTSCPVEVSAALVIPEGSDTLSGMILGIFDYRYIARDAWAELRQKVVPLMEDYVADRSQVGPTPKL